MLKNQIRKVSTQQRDSLTNEQYQLFSEGLLRQFTLLGFAGVKTLHIFLPITEKKEPNTFLFIEWLEQNHPEIKIIVPKADFETALLTHHEYLGDHDLKKSIYNILEPQKGKIHDGEIDMVLVPLLAFDEQGYRVGYGKGFYDRFLEPLKNAQKIGVSLFPAIDKIDDIHANDVRLDLCLTPTNTIAF
jgi:5-formyltetrahydrofolate cyclo-ligase